MSTWVERFSLSGKTALITGASKGIGFEICRVFADAGADIVATARDVNGLEKVAERVRSSGRNCTTIVCDLADSNAISDLVQQTQTEIGTVDILVNNAGIARVASAEEMPLADWDEVMAVNVRAPFQLARELAPGMRAQKWGKIINISSQAGVVALVDHAAYSASKAALNALTRAMMVEWAGDNIQVNAICPTVVLTDMGKEVWGPAEKSEPMLARIPAGRFGEPVEVADLALYLASPASGMVNGESIMLEGGYAAI